MTARPTESSAPEPGPLLSIPLADIDVDPGHNPRGDVDPEAQAALEASVRQVGILQPVLVRAADGREGYLLVAGHRRLAAARAAGLARIPALLLRSGDEPAERALAALAENVLRRDLNPIEEARALERIRSARGYRTQAALAARLGVAPGWVSERLRLLRLPEGCQQAVAAGSVPLRACPSLERIARVSGQVAEACCALVVHGAASAGQLEADPAGVVRLIARAEWAGERPCCVPVLGYGALRIAELPLPADRAQELLARAEACGQEWLRLDDADADAARAYGALLEFAAAADRFARERFICSAEFLADRLAFALERAEERAAAAAALPEAEHSERSSGQEGVPAPDRAAEREQARLERGLAERANAELGRRLAEAYTAPAISADMARLVCLIVFDRLGRQLGPDGLRLCAPGWQETETRTLRSGAVRERTRYPDRREAKERAQTFLAAARTPQEILGRTLQAIIAASYADQAAVPLAERGYTTGAATFGQGEIARLVSRLARDVLPERLARLARAVPGAGDVDGTDDAPAVAPSGPDDAQAAADGDAAGDALAA